MRTRIPMERDMIIEPGNRAASGEDRVVSRRAGSTHAAARRRVLLVEDESDLARVVKRHVEDIGCQVEVAPTGEIALEAAAASEFDLVLLDVMLPGIDGLEVCRRLRERQQYMPVLMLTARSNEIDKVMGLETGADDYLTKPFSVRELLARIKAIFRRMDALAAPRATPEGSIEVAGGLRIDPTTREVFVRGRSIALTQKEFDLLRHFAENPGRVYTRAQLLDAVWGYSHEGYEHAVNCHINRLRAKIEPNPSEPIFLLTAWGVGYKFAIDPHVPG
jgi:DNA-binding response OmpR family regulator